MTKAKLLNHLASLFGYYCHTITQPHQPKQIIFTQKGYERE